MHLIKLFRPFKSTGFSLLALLAVFTTVHVLINIKSQPAPVCSNINEKEGKSSANDAEIEGPSESVGESESDRILIWILTGISNHMRRAVHVKLTWGKHFDKLLFMSSTEDERIGSIALPGVTEGHDKLWPKTQRAFEYVWQHHKDDADWFMKADDDTFVFSHNLRNYIKKFNPDEPYYIGQSNKFDDVPVAVNYGGAGYILSKAALRLFIEALQRGGDCHTEIREEHHGDEDTELAICVASMNVTATNATDSEGKIQMVDLGSIYYADEMRFSTNVLTFHPVSPSLMYPLERLAHTSKTFKQ